MQTIKNFYFSLKHKMRHAMRIATEKSSSQIILYGSLGFFSYIPFYFINLAFSAHAYESIILRIIATLVCLPLMLKNYWPHKLTRYLPVYWYLSLLYTLPFFFMFMLFKNNMSHMWQINMVQLVLLLILLVDWLSFIVLILLGTSLAYLAYFLTTPIVNLSLFNEGEMTFLYCVVIYALFSRGRQKVEDEKLQLMQSLAATIAHELRTPLRTINSSVSGLKDYLPNLIAGYQLAKQHELPVAYVSPLHYQALLKTCQHVELETEAAFNVINMLLLNVSHSEIDTTEFQTISMEQCIGDTLRRYPFDGGEVKLVFWKEGNDFLFKGNSLLFAHVLFNLFKNALYYVKAAGKGEIHIWTETGKLHNVLHFKDTGQGISAKVLPHIFDRFYTKTLHGTGVGLAFCKMVIESFNGKIICDSEEGKYTEFKIYFPNDAELQLSCINENGQTVNMSV